MSAIALLLVALVALFANGVNTASANSIAGKFPQVLGLRITEESIKRHHTEQYQPAMGFAVRRGMPFDLDVELSLDLFKGNVILLEFDQKDGKVPHFWTEVTGGPTKTKSGTYLYRITVTSKEDDPIGEWTDMTAVVGSAKAELSSKALEGYIYYYPFTVKVVDKDPEMFQQKQKEDKVKGGVKNEILEKVQALEEQYQNVLSELEKMDQGIQKSL